MNAPKWSRASYLVASIRTVSDEMERAIADGDSALRRALREQLSEQFDALSRLLREGDEAQ